LKAIYQKSSPLPSASAENHAFGKFAYQKSSPLPNSPIKRAHLSRCFGFSAINSAALLLSKRLTFAVFNDSQPLHVLAKPSGIFKSITFSMNASHAACQNSGFDAVSLVVHTIYQKRSPYRHIHTPYLSKKLTL
jgi:hypothetical protein